VVDGIVAINNKLIAFGYVCGMGLEHDIRKSSIKVLWFQKYNSTIGRFSEIRKASFFMKRARLLRNVFYSTD
jgi:hypothetical protein